MAYPQVAATEGHFSYSATTTLRVDLPAGISSGDLLVAKLGFTVGGEDGSWPAGWTVLFRQQQSNQLRFEAAYKVADGSEGSSINVTITNARIYANLSYRITGYTGTPEAIATSSSGTTPDSPSLTPTWGSAETLWLTSAAHLTTVSAPTYPTNYTNGFMHGAGGDVGLPVVASARRELTASSEDPGAFTFGFGAHWAAGTFAIQPAGGGGGGSAFPHHYYQQMHAA